MQSTSNKVEPCRPQGYILENEVTHARWLPSKSKHKFMYPTLSLLVSLDALESKSLDLGRGWIFGYGGLWNRLIGLRPDPYLTDQGSKQSIKGKLKEILVARDLMDIKSTLEDAWMMTMPSCLGFEGINPLTVYFCYKSGLFWLTVLEIHNTFGESHVHVLQVGDKEDESLTSSFDHQWTFLREFHVSPFNDRSGFYTVSIKCPSHPPTPSSDLTCAPPKPLIRVHLYTQMTKPPSLDTLKLTAILRPVTSRPLTTFNILKTLSRFPFTLFLSFPRIIRVAWTLHYNKRLDVHPRPDPLPALCEWGAGMDLPKDGPNRHGGGVKFLGMSFLEKYARRRVTSFLDQRVEETGATVTLISANPTVPRLSFSPVNKPTDAYPPPLTIYYLSPRFFTILFLCPSAAHALLLGYNTEKIFFPSSESSFLETFSQLPQSGRGMSNLQRLRCRPIPKSLHLPVPPSHPFDKASITTIFGSTIIVLTLLFLERLEYLIFDLIRARMVDGEEPWKQWDRAVAIYQNDKTIQLDNFGSKYE